MSNNVRHVDFIRRRRVTIIPPVDPTYFSGSGYELQSKAGAVQIVFEKPVNTWSVRRVRAFIDQLEQVAMTAELMGEDG